MASPPRSGPALGNRHRAADELETLIDKAERKCAAYRVAAARHAQGSRDGHRAEAMLRVTESYLAQLRAGRRVLTDGDEGRTEGGDDPDPGETT